MSELDDVRTTIGVIDGLRAKVAELEAENERLRGIMGICSGPCHGLAGEKYIVKVYEVVAELAALKWMLNEACHMLSDAGYGFPRRYSIEGIETDLRNRWAERGTE